jgi:stage IV sporulation protein FB
MTTCVILYLTATAAAIALHELAHVAVACGVGLRVKRFGLCWKGVYIVRESGTPLVNAYISLAGPIMNLLLAFMFLQISPKFAGINFVLGLFNLLPFKSTDGHRALNCYKAIYAMKRIGWTLPNQAIPNLQAAKSE